MLVNMTSTLTKLLPALISSITPSDYKSNWRLRTVLNFWSQFSICTNTRATAYWNCICTERTSQFSNIILGNGLCIYNWFFFPQVIYLRCRINKNQAKGSKCKPHCISAPQNMGVHMDFIPILNSNSMIILSFPRSITETRSYYDSICLRNSCISGKETS